MTQISLNQFCFPHHCFCVSFPDGCTWKLQGMGLYQMRNCFRVWITGALPLMETEHWSIPNLWSVSQHRSTQSIGSRALEHSQLMEYSRALEPSQYWKWSTGALPVYGVLQSTGILPVLEAEHWSTPSF